MLNIDSNFLIGCLGAASPEALRLYNLRTQPILRWSWSYLIYSIPFILIGGSIAWILEPTTKWAAFYSGLTAPILLTTAMKDNVKAQKELQYAETEIFNIIEEANAIKNYDRETINTEEKYKELYKLFIIKEMEKEYPLNKKSRIILQFVQQSLEITDKDAKDIENNVIAQMGKITIPTLRVACVKIKIDTTKSISITGSIIYFLTSLMYVIKVLRENWIQQFQEFLNGL